MRYTVYNPEYLRNPVTVGTVEIFSGETRGPFDLSTDEVAALQKQRVHVSVYEEPQAQPTIPAVGGGGNYGTAQYGSFSNFGMTLNPNERTRLMFDIDPTSTRTMEFLLNDFAGFRFWDGRSIRSRRRNDTFFCRAAFSIVAQAIDGRVVFEVDVGGTTPQVVESKEIFLRAGAGQSERPTHLFVTSTRSGLLTNGGALYLTSSVGAVVSDPSLSFFPHSAAPLVPNA